MTDELYFNFEDEYSNELYPDIKRFFQEARPATVAPRDDWINPQVKGFPTYIINNKSSLWNKFELVSDANKVLVCAGHKAGEYNKIYYFYEEQQESCDMTVNAVCAIYCL